MVNGIIIIRGLQVNITKLSKSHVLSVINMQFVSSWSAKLKVLPQ